MRIGSHFFNNYGLNIQQQFGWSAQMGPLLASRPSSNLGMLQDSFSGLTRSMGPWMMTNSVSYAAMPDFANSGHLDVDKKKGVVTTPGGYEVAVANGRVRIKSPNGKFTDLKAEPPNRQVTRTTTNAETRTQTQVVRQLPRDPVVRESDGDIWRYQGTGSFHLPDGTKISIHEKGEGKDLHIDQVDIYNMNKHVAVKSQLQSSNWQTVKSDVLSQQATNWQNTGSRTRRRGFQVVRDTTQQRQVTRTIRDTQAASQKFQTSFSNVRRDGFFHDAMTDDGQHFRAAGDGDDWSVNNREVISGAGKGKDDRTKAYQLGDFVNKSWIGYRPPHVPWKLHASTMSSVMGPLYMSQRSRRSHHWDQLSAGFGAVQGRPHLGVVAAAENMGGFKSIYGGPLGGAALYGAGYADGFQDGNQFGRMTSSVDDLLAMYGRLDNMQEQRSQRRMADLDFFARRRARRPVS